MAETKTYSGGCHCGSVRYEVEVSLEKIIACNCSICTKQGLLLAFTVPESVRIDSGKEKLRSYQFNKKVISHMFCQDCGVETFARGRMPSGAEMVAVNVRCLDDVDLNAMTPVPFNGRDLM